MARTSSIEFTADKELKGTKFHIADSHVQSTKIYLTAPTLSSDGSLEDRTVQCSEHVNHVHIRLDGKGNVVGAEINLDPEITMMGQSIRMFGGHTPFKIPPIQKAVKAFLDNIQSILDGFKDKDAE